MRVLTKILTKVWLLFINIVLTAVTVVSFFFMSVLNILVGFLANTCRNTNTHNYSWDELCESFAYNLWSIWNE